MSLRSRIFSRNPVGLIALTVAVCLALAWSPTGAQQSDGTSPVQSQSEAGAQETFGQALQREYNSMIRQEREKYEYLFNRSRFQQKAEAAGQGQNVQPEDPASYSIGDQLGVALAEGRMRLLRALDANARTSVPALAAKAQAKYDCWVSRAAMRASSDDILVCEQQFMIALQWLEAAVMPVRASDQFNQFLARDYLAYADFEARDQQDFIDSRHFAQKGLRASAASSIDEIEPEVIGRWNLYSEADAPTFVEWRARLVRALQRGRTEKPRVAATAQVMFDCWVERTSEHNDQAHISRCRDAFLAALQELEGQPETQTQQSDEITIYFDFDKSDIRASEQEKIAAAVSRIQESNANRVTVVGHTDTSGSTRYNLRLSFRRAEAVKQALEQAGVQIPITTIFRGEADLAVETGDNVREPRNRRATITIFQ